MERRLLFVDDEEVIRITLTAILSQNGFEVATAATVAEALQKITSEKFDVLLSDLNIGNPGDGFTVVSAMRRTQPDAVTIILTGYPAFETALEAIRQQVDDYILKEPADVPALVHSIESKLAIPPRQRQLPPPKRVAMLLQEHLDRIEDLWLSAVENDVALSRTSATRAKRLRRIRAVLQEVIRTAQAYAGQESLHPGHGHDIAAHDYEGCTPIMVLREFCLLRAVLSRVVQENLLAVNLSYAIPDLARVNETLDEQTQAALELLLEPV